jgi:hypothetical protein
MALFVLLVSLFPRSLVRRHAAYVVDKWLMCSIELLAVAQHFETLVQTKCKLDF